MRIVLVICAIGLPAIGFMASRMFPKKVTYIRPAVSPLGDLEGSLDIDYVLKNKGKLDDKLVRIKGRVYTDRGGFHWLVRESEYAPISSLEIRISAWPFRSDPPLGELSREVSLLGIFDDANSTFFKGMLIGPMEIGLMERTEAIKKANERKHEGSQKKEQQGEAHDWIQN